MDLNLMITAIAAVGALALAIWMIVLERQGTTPGKPRLLPTTPVLFFAILVLVLALAHFVTIVTGSPHLGRMG